MPQSELVRNRLPAFPRVYVENGARTKKLRPTVLPPPSLQTALLPNGVGRVIVVSVHPSKAFCISDTLLVMAMSAADLQVRCAS